MDKNKERLYHFAQKVSQAQYRAEHTTAAAAASPGSKPYYDAAILANEAFARAAAEYASELNLVVLRSGGSKV